MIENRLYQPIQKWRIGAAFGAAVLIHCAAIAVAAIHQNQTTEFVSGSGEFFPEVSLTMDPPVYPEPPDIPEPPPTPIATSEFPEVEPNPPPVPRSINSRTTPIVKVNSGRTSSSQGFATARINALGAPRLEYPYEARRQKLTGSGIVVMTVDRLTGCVTGVAMEVSTGSVLLDNATIGGFRRWRFKPGTASKVRAPVTFTLTGAQY